MLSFVGSDKRVENSRAYDKLRGVRRGCLEQLICGLAECWVHFGARLHAAKIGVSLDKFLI